MTGAYRYRWPEAGSHVIEPADQRIALFILANPATEDASGDDHGAHRIR